MVDKLTPLDPAKRRARPRKSDRMIVAVAEVGSREHELRMKGKTWAEIATICHHTTAKQAADARNRYLQRAGLALAQEKRAEALAMEVERLDTLQASYWEAAVRGYPAEEGEPAPRPDVRAAEIVLKIIAARTKLLGLDEGEQTAQGPRTIVVTGTSEQYVATLKSLIDSESIQDAEIVDDD